MSPPLTETAYTAFFESQEKELEKVKSMRSELARVEALLETHERAGEDMQKDL